MSQEYTRVPSEEKMTEKRSLKALEAHELLDEGHVYPTARKPCKGRSFGKALLFGFVMTFLTISTVRLITGRSCLFTALKHVDNAPPHNQLVAQQGAQLTPIQHELAAPVHRQTKAEMDMIVLNDSAHPIPDMAVQALASAKLRALKAAGYDVSSLNVAVIPQNKEHPYTVKQATELGMKAIEHAKALAKGLDMKMKMMAKRMKEGLAGAKGLLNQLFDQMKKQE